MIKQEINYDRLEDLPSLQKGWVRIVHRCKDEAGRIENIKTNGLIFNREAAELSPAEIGGQYNHITEMASVYDENEFWQSMKKDDFYGYNDARYADTKLIFDIPMKEFAFLQVYGSKVKGRVEAKYLVGCIQNYNGTNPQLSMAADEVERAEKISRKNPPSKVTENKIQNLIAELKERYSRVDENKVVDRVEKYIKDFVSYREEKNKKILPRNDYSARMR